MMYRLQVKLESYALIGSGEGFGSVIDADVVFDDYGLPYIPARRIKGLLRESALEICEMGLGFSRNELESLFGLPAKEGRLRINSLLLRDYNNIKKWITWAFDNKKFRNVINRNSVIDVFTEIKCQTAVDEKGVAKEHSLRTIRVLKPAVGTWEPAFEGSISIEPISSSDVEMLAYACMNLRHVGTMRNRGLGNVCCSLYENSSDLTEKFRNKLKVSYEKD